MIRKHINLFVLPAMSLSLSSLLLGVPATAAIHPSAVGSVPPDSFLRYHAATVGALAQQVTLDPAVRGRLANYFHVSEAQMTSYVRHHLVLANLPNAGEYRVACVGRTGRRYWIQARLPAGTPVFASRVTGRPILKLACGNPMVSALPKETNLFAPARLAAQKLPVMQTASLAPGLQPAEFLPAGLVTPVSDVAPTIVAVSPSLESFTAPLAGGGGSAFSALGPILAGGAALAVASSGGHSSGSSPNVVPPAPIPEASTSASFGLLLTLGLGGLTAAKRKKQTA